MPGLSPLVAKQILHHTASLKNLTAFFFSFESKLFVTKLNGNQLKKCRLSSLSLTKVDNFSFPVSFFKTKYLQRAVEPSMFTSILILPNTHLCCCSPTSRDFSSLVSLAIVISVTWLGCDLDTGSKDRALEASRCLSQPLM